MASNIDFGSSSIQPNQLDEDKFNEFFTNTGPQDQSKIPSYSNGNFLDNMPDNTQFDGFSIFDDITEDAVMDYIQRLGSDKSIHDSIPV